MIVTWTSTPFFFSQGFRSLPQIATSLAPLSAMVGGSQSSRDFGFEPSPAPGEDCDAQAVRTRAAVAMAAVHFANLRGLLIRSDLSCGSRTKRSDGARGVLGARISRRRREGVLFAGALAFLPAHVSATRDDAY